MLDPSKVDIVQSILLRDCLLDKICLFLELYAVKMLVGIKRNVVQEIPVLLSYLQTL